MEWYRSSGREEEDGSELCVMVWMWHVPNRLVCLKTRSPLGGSVFGT